MSEIGSIPLVILLATIVVIFLLRSRNVIDLILQNSLFSVLTVIMYLILDAPDVGMTEAVIGIIASVFAILTVKFLYKEAYDFEEKFNPVLLVGLLICASIFIYAAADLPQFGQAVFDQYYLANTAKDIGIASTVTAILASYRGYDTLLETIVILISGIGIYQIIGRDTPPSPILKIDGSTPPQDQLINIMTQFILPLVMLFAFIIQVHGEISPGGGFQAGAILGAAFILYFMSINDQLLISKEKLKNIAVLGVFIYVITGFIGLLLNAGFLNYNILLNNQGLAQQLGIILVELGVGLTVSSVMLLIYFCLASNDDLSNQS